MHDYFHCEFYLTQRNVKSIKSLSDTYLESRFTLLQVDNWSNRY